MRVNLLVLDLDGTVLDSRGRLPEAVREAVRRLGAKGVAAALASARPPRSLRPFAQALELTGPAICYNGAMVVDLATRQVLTHNPIPLALAREVIGALKAIDPAALVTAEVADIGYAEPNWQPATATDRSGFHPTIVADLARDLREDVTKLLASGPNRYRERAGEALAAAFGGKVSVTRSDTDLVQVMNGGVTKVAALRFLAGRLGVPRERIAAIGDAPNDIEMLRYAGCGIAMGNAPAEVKAAARHVTATNDEAGVALAIERWVLAPGDGADAAQ
jgi:hypothetical protein